MDKATNQNKNQKMKDQAQNKAQNGMQQDCKDCRG